MSGAHGDPIAAFYDRHPYPAPIDALDTEVASWRDGFRRRVEHARLWPSLPYRDDHTILVAGCGTSQAARYAARYPNARVLGIDVAENSLDATRRLRERHALENLELQQLSIEELGSIGSQFDQIVCTGVLHHLPEPDAGLRALRDTLAPAGVLELMVYATHGRHGVYVLQDYCRMLGLSPSTADVSELVATLRELPADHPIRPLLAAPDFRTDGALADALLNPRDRPYTVPELLDMLEETGLRFGRWTRQAPYRPQCGSMSELPHGQRLAAMPEHQQFAAMELFRGTIRRHGVIAVRDDTPLPPQPVPWHGDTWRSFVPIRPTTVAIVEDRLPDGVAAALINQAHVDRDLVFFADRAERRAYELMDGAREAGDIGGVSLELLRRLWWHDLVMIDSSRASGAAAV